MNAMDKRSLFNLNLMKNFQNKANIVRVSKIIRHFLFAGLVLWIIGIPVVLFPVAVSLWNRLGLTSGSRYLQCGLPLLMAFCLIVNLKLFRFFDRLKNGFLFDAQTVGNLDGAGRWWIALWFFESLFYGIGHKLFPMTIAPYFGSGFFAGLTLIFVAWLLKEAQELQDEQALTV
jgi:hypothetical protein